MSNAPPTRPVESQVVSDVESPRTTRGQTRTCAARKEPGANAHSGFLRSLLRVLRLLLLVLLLRRAYGFATRVSVVASRGLATAV